MTPRAASLLASLACAAALAACANREAVILGPSPADRLDLAAWLADHPLPPGVPLRAFPVAKTEGSSHAIVQVRTREEPHIHAAHDLSVTVLRGRGRLNLATRDPAGPAFTASGRLMLPGDSAIVPRGTVHWFVNTGTAPAVALATFSPPHDGTDSVPVPDFPEPAEAGR